MVPCPCCMALVIPAVMDMRSTLAPELQSAEVFTGPGTSCSQDKAHNPLVWTHANLSKAAGFVWMTRNFAIVCVVFVE